MRARAGLSIVMWFLVLGAFSACQEASKHKSQSIQSTQVSASSGVPSQDSLSDNRKFSANKATQPNQVQPQQPHSDSSISASKANADSTISTSSSPDTDLSPKPKAITKKQAHDFCHSDWVKQHYPCKKGVTCHYTQEVVASGLDYQCKILSVDQGLAAMLMVKEKENEEMSYYPIIDLIDISHLRVLDHFEDRKTFLGGPSYVRAYLQLLTDPISKKYHLFNFISWDVSNSSNTEHWDIQWMNMYQYKNNHISKILGGMEISSSSQSQDADMEDKLSKSVKNRCVNEIEKEKINYRFAHNKTKNMPDIYLTKVKKHKWVRGYHVENPGVSAANQYLCDDDKPLKVIKRKKDVIKKRRIVFDGKKYPLPKDWEIE